MRETLQRVLTAKGAPKRQYEYLILSVRADEPAPLAYQRLREHAEYGKWELERSLLYIGGSRQFWLRRKVLRVERTLEIH